MNPLAVRPGRIASGVMVLLLAALLASCSAQRRGAFQMPPVPVEVAPAHEETMIDRFRAVGTIDADEIVKVVNEISAVVRQLPFREGQVVTKGALLARLDDSEIRAEAQRAEALRDQARTRHDRVHKLFEQHAASQQELDDASSDLKVAEANHALARARLAKTRIVSPLTGVVSRRLVSPGAFLAVGQTITEVASVDLMKVNFSVPERYLPQLKSGARVFITTTAYPGVTFEGRVSVVDPILDPATRTVQLVARVSNRGRRLRPGMSADVTATLGERPHAITVPDEAVFAEGTQNFVFLVKPDSTVMRQVVVLGSRDSSRAEVVQGLKAGDLIVRAGYQKLFDGAHVMPLPPGSGEAVPPSAAAGGAATGKPAATRGGRAGGVR